MAGGDHAGAVGVDQQMLGLLGMDAQAQSLQVQDQLGHVFLHAGHGREFVEHTLNVDRGHGRTGQRAEQDTAKAVQCF